MLVGKLRCSPRLNDTLARDKFEVTTSNVTIPGGDFGTNLVRHARLGSRHLRMGKAVEPSVINLLRRSRDRGSEFEIVGHKSLLRQLKADLRYLHPRLLASRHYAPL